MSANLWDASTASIRPDADGVYTAGKDGTVALKSAISGLAALAENQTIHMGASLRGANGKLKPYVKYMDAAGHNNSVGYQDFVPTDEWVRLEQSCVVPSGMTIVEVGFYNKYATGDIQVANPIFSYGSPVTLASSAHTPYATQDHVSVTYATKASLKVTDDSIKAEVTQRTKTDRNVADLSSRLTQTANSLTSEISDRRSAITTVTGLATAAQSTADGAAKQANLYTINSGDAGAVPKWIHLGTLTSAGDASSTTIAIVFGDGYNGSASQNSKLTITIKDGWQSTQSATKACGVTAMRENCDTALVDVLAQSATVYDVWVYAPWAYSNGRYSISGQYAAWQHSGATQKAEPATSATQVKQDVAYRLADATKAQTMATENQSSIKQLSTSITAEVTERSKLAGRVGTLESTSGTHASRLEQLAASIKSLVKGESTYTDPDGKSATSGIYSLVTQTRDSVTALFGQYTKTADLASTQAVKDAKKAGTDAQAAASAAQTTANSAKANAATAQSTANAAKGTADGLATLIRADSTGITVGKSTDGQTWSTGRTRMTDSAFQVLDKAGATVTQMAKDGASFLAGLVRLQARKDGSNTVASMSSDFLSLDSLWQAVMRAGDRTGGSYASGYAAAIAEVTGKRGTARLYCTQGSGSAVTANNAFTVLPDSYDLSQPEYLAAALLGTGGGGLGVTHSQEGVPITSDLDACGPGVFSYDTSTTSRPTDYGTCVCIRAGDGKWLFQVALPTAGDPYWRRNVNGAGWTSWWTITPQ